MASPIRAAFTLELPRGAERYLVFNERNAAPMGEVSGDGVRKIALPPGRYLVARRTPGRYALALADGSWGGAMQMRPGDFRSVSEDQLQLRNGRVEMNPWRLVAKLGAEWIVGAADAGGARLSVGVLRFRGPEVKRSQVDGIECLVVLTVKSESDEALAGPVFAFDFQFDDSLGEFNIGDPRQAIAVSRV